MFRVIAAIKERFENWGRVLLNGMISVLLGILIWRQWLSSALWLIGLFAGIEMIFCGWARVMLGLSVHGLSRQTM